MLRKVGPNCQGILKTISLAHLAVPVSPWPRESWCKVERRHIGLFTPSVPRGRCDAGIARSTEASRTQRTTCVDGAFLGSGLNA